jgi:uncharacterized protein YjbI with pentapeptide repeats
LVNIHNTSRVAIAIWRLEPEISADRQMYLATLRDTPPLSTGDTDPFKGIKLTRADIEWLLTTHENHHGPVDWMDPQQRERRGINLCGADLRGEAGHPSNLSRLPLSRANLRGAHLEGVSLHAALLNGVDLSGAYLEGANLSQARLEQVDCLRAHLQSADLSEAHMHRASLRLAHLEGADLRLARLENADVRGAVLAGADLRNAHLEGADLKAAHLEGMLVEEEERARLRVWVPRYPDNHPAANLSLSYFDMATSFDSVTLGVSGSFVRVADTRWNGVNLAVVKWPREPLLGEDLAAENAAKQNKDPDLALHELSAAVRANRQLAAVLREQGLNEVADHFAYRAQVCQREVFRRQGKSGAYLFSLLLAILAGYGYRLRRILFAYGSALIVFAIAYFATGQWFGGTHLAMHQAILVSLTAIHGRVFFSSFGLDNVQSWIAAVQSVVGIVIEGVFVAMLVQRFFAR